MKIFSFAAALTAFSAQALKPRDMAPTFSDVNAVMGTELTKVSLDDFENQWKVMLFYPFDFTYVCPTELVAFSDAMPQFKELGAEVMGISCDSHFTHLAWAQTPRDEGGVGELNYPLLADISKQMAKDYGVLVTDEDDGMYGAALRGLFILDPTNKLRSMQINDDAVGRSVEETIRLIQAFQFADEHGEVCPANWQPGDKTIVPDQAKKMQYFRNAGESKKEEVIDPNAFRVQVTQVGSGPKVPNGAKVTVHYTGSLQDGTVFDSSVTKNRPFTFTLGAGQVIKCWDEGVSQLQAGAKATLTCPADMAYGSRGAGGMIPPNATLKFEVELLSFK